MIRSMTGYGRGTYQDSEKSITIEIKAVNHRYCDISVKMPRKYSFAEESIKSAIKTKLYRGKIEVNVIVDNWGKSDLDIRLDKELAKKYYYALSELKDVLDTENPQKKGFFDYSEIRDAMGETAVASNYFNLIAKMPDVIKGTASEEDEEEMNKAFADATDKAVADILKMREVEGEKLIADISMRAEIIDGIRKEIEKRAPELEAEYAKKFKERMDELLDGVAEIPEERVAVEAAVFADKANITEELVRLDSHVNQLREFLKGKEESVGKKIDFLIQEMNREANTIGSKSNDKEITSKMLELKAEIEKIREQVQNIE